MHSSLVRACRITAFGLAAIVLLASVIVLTGWGLGRHAMITFGASGVAMNPLTAACFLLLSSALLLALPVPGGRVEQQAARVLSSIALVLAVLKLALLHAARGPDTWLFSSAVSATLPLNRMAPNTATIMIPVALAVMLLDVKAAGRRIAPLFVLAAMPLTLLVIVGFVYGVHDLYGWGAYIPMARNTAISFVALQLAVLGGRVEHGFTRIFVAKGAGGIAARRLMPAAILLPLVAGYLRLRGQRAGLYGPEFGTVLLSLATILTSCAVVWWTAAGLYRVDNDRAEADVRLQQLIRNVPLGIVVLDQHGTARLCNDAFVELFHYPRSELIGRRVDDLIAPDGDEGETASLTRRGFAGESLRRATVRRRRDGLLVDVELYVVPLTFEGRSIGTYGVYRDLKR